MLQLAHFSLGLCTVCFICTHYCCHVLQVCHVAAQYGQTAVIYHLALRWNLDVGVIDNDGRTALHWAAYKGFGDTIRLLLVLGASVSATDKEGELCFLSQPQQSLSIVSELFD